MSSSSAESSLDRDSVFSIPNLNIIHRLHVRLGSTGWVRPVYFQVSAEQGISMRSKQEAYCIMKCVIIWKCCEHVIYSADEMITRCTHRFSASGTVTRLSHLRQIKNHDDGFLSQSLMILYHPLQSHTRMHNKIDEELRKESTYLPA